MSTSQVKIADANEPHPFQKDLMKKIAKCQKKLKEIQTLEDRIKNKEIIPDDKASAKIASKVQINTEMAEVQGQLDQFAAYQKEQAKADKK
jgi:hypothetical protein